MAIVVYDAPRCPFCARTRIVLAEKGVPYDTVTIDLDDRPAWLVARNPPDGRVPVLEEDGWVLPESAVIDEYLEERYPEPALLPDDPGERAAARLLVFRFDDALGDPYYAFRREEPGAGAWLFAEKRGSWWQLSARGRTSDPGVLLFAPMEGVSPPPALARLAAQLCSQRERREDLLACMQEQRWELLE